MKKIILIIILAAIIIAAYFLTRPEESVMNHAGIEKFARINAELAIEKQRYESDTSAFLQARDSIFEHYDVDSQWIADLTYLIDNQPQHWEEIYDMMIEHGEYIKDSLMHKKQLQRRDTSETQDTTRQKRPTQDD